MTPKISPTFRRALGCLAAGTLLSLSTQVPATEFSADGYGFSAYGAPGGATSMRVTGPDGFAVETDSLSYSGDEALPDGTYKYEITGSVPRMTSAVDVKGNLNQGRSASVRPGKATGVIDAGHFRILNGSVVVPDNVVEPGNTSEPDIYLEPEPETRNFSDSDG